MKRPSFYAALIVLLCSLFLFAASATDSFTRGDNADIGTDWNVISAACQIVSNKVEASTLGSVCSEAYATGTWGNDQSATVTIATLTAGGEGSVGAVVRGNTAGTNTKYTCFATKGGANTSRINRRLAGANMDLVTENATTWAATDTIKCEIIGTTIKLYRNGSGTALLSTTDGTIASGNPGIAVYQDTTLANAEADDFTAADIAGGSSAGWWRSLQRRNTVQ